MVEVDGNDLLEMYKVSKEEIDRVRVDGKPVLIEAYL